MCKDTRSSFIQFRGRGAFAYGRRNQRLAGGRDSNRRLRIEMAYFFWISCTILHILHRFQDLHSIGTSQKKFNTKKKRKERFF